MGADVVIDLRIDHAGRAARRRSATLTHGEGADVVIEAAGSARAFEEG